MCCLMGSHFDNWIDYHGDIFNRVTRMESHIFGIWRGRNFWKVGILSIKKREDLGKNKLYGAVVLTFNNQIALQHNLHSILENIITI